MTLVFYKPWARFELGPFQKSTIQYLGFYKPAQQKHSVCLDISVFFACNFCLGFEKLFFLGQALLSTELVPTGCCFLKHDGRLFTFT